MAAEIFSSQDLHERMFLTWGSNLGPLACQADTLPIELPRPARGVLTLLSFVTSSGSVFDLIPKEDKKRMNEAKKSTTGTKIDERPGGSVSKETSLAGSSVGQEIKQPAKSSQEPVQSSTNRVPVMSQSTQEPVLASLEEQRRNNVPLFQAGAGFKPFMRDPEKQERYEKYLALAKQGHKGKNKSILHTRQGVLHLSPLPTIESLGVRYGRKFPSRGSQFGITRLCRVMPKRDLRGGNFLSVPNMYYRYFFLHTIYLFIHLFSCD